MEIEEKSKKQSPKNNLTENETNALRKLRQRDDVIITKADKGEAAVIIDVGNCIHEANRQLNNTDFYKKLPNDPAKSNGNKANNIVDEFKLQRLLNDTTAHNLKTLDARTPNFYMQPKIHKESNPGRPVISSINCHTTKTLQYIVHH